MRTLAALAAIGLGGFFGGCSNDSSGRCAQNSDCGSGQICDTGVCKTASIVRTIGQNCTSDANCSVGSSCATAMPGGLCTYNCAGDTCPSGAVCTDLRASGSGIFCSTACTTQSDCRSGYTCCPGFGACVPQANCPAQGRPLSATLGKQCDTANPCTGAGEVCAGSTNPTPEFPSPACTAACNPSDQTTCPSGSKCVSTSTGSFCFPGCASPSDCAGVNAMFTSCTDGACRSNTASPSCTPATAPTPTPIPKGISPNAPPNQPTTCQRTVQPATSPLVLTPAPGQKMVGNTVMFDVPPGTGTISILSQGVPSGSITVTNGTQPPDTINFRGTPISNSVVPTLLKANGNLIYDDDPPTAPPPDPSGMDVFYGGFSPWAGMMTVPNASPLLAHTALQGGLTTGKWQFNVNDFALECANPAHASDCGSSKSLTSVYDVQVLLKPGVAPATGTVDIAFYFVGGPVSYANAPTDPSFNRMLRSLAQLYGAAGLCLGNVYLYDLPTWAKTKYSVSLNPDDDSACGDLGQLFTLSATGNQINIFVVNGFTGGTAGSTTVGVDGTIPGPSTVGGTVNSAAAVNGSDLASGGAFCSGPVDPTACGADEVAYIVAHEGGHFMGLYHTTEMFGDSFDPLSDTKTCACTSCAPANVLASCSSNHPAGTPTVMANNYCTSTSSTSQCGGGDNMMFWRLAAESRGTFTPQQGQVMRANPVVR